MHSSGIYNMRSEVIILVLIYYYGVFVRKSAFRSDIMLFVYDCALTEFAAVCA